MWATVLPMQEAVLVVPVFWPQVFPSALPYTTPTLQDNFYPLECPAQENAT